MQISRCGLPPRRHSPDSDYDYDHHDGITQTQRRHLGKSTGSAHQQTLGSPAYCHSRQLPLSPLHSIPTSPILPTHNIVPAYGSSFQGQHSMQSDGSSREPTLARLRGARNPIYSWKHFADYRAKVTQKESENEDPTWPLYLEDAFLDALLLVPFMGRKKISCKGRLYGRNMLLTEYLWICHWLLFPPSPGETVPVGREREKHPMFRGRKQVSSHIQVLKGFFVSHPCFHFFFPRKNDEREDSKRHIKDDEGEMESFKSHKVLTALAEGRLPDARPNYEYFARLLAADSEAFMRPKTCWIYVSSSEVTLSSDYKVARSSDGTVLNADAYTADGQRLDCAGDYPHLVLNSNKETRRDLRNSRGDEAPKHLLHEYTRTLTQKESSSIKDVSIKWDHQFPELRHSLLAALEETDPSHNSTSRCVVGPCDIIRFEVVLDLHSTSRFPAGTHLEGSVQLQVCRPELANHCWRSVTSVSKPQELEHENEEPFWNCVNSCDLVSRQRDVVEIPFPAKSWASTFFRLATYGQTEQESQGPCSMVKAGDDSERTRGRHSNKSKLPDKLHTTQELLEQVAMYQEIWSAPDNGSENPSWTRRAIVLWTFKNVHTKIDDKGKTATVPSGTNWRFLTKVDPTSQVHQQSAYISGSSSISPSPLIGASMSPDPAYMSLATTAAIQENFKNAAYGTTSHTTMVPDHSLHSYPSTLGVLDGPSSGGLSTSSLIGSLSPSYTHSFDSVTISSTDSLHHDLNYLSHGSATDNVGMQVTGAGDHNSTGLFELDVSVANSMFHENFDHQAWAGIPARNLGSLDQQATTYVDSQYNVSWADPTPGLGPDDICSRGTTPWGDVQDNLWTATDHCTTGVPADSSQQQQHNDMWATTTSQNWLQSTGVTADAGARKHDYHVWNHHDSQSAHLRHHQNRIASSPSLAPSPSLHSAPAHIRKQDSSGTQHQRDQSTNGSGSMPQHVAAEVYNTNTTSRKRERTVDDEMGEGCESYPSTSIRKFARAHSTTSRSREHGLLL